MRRRRLLTALSLLPASLAGCGGRADPTPVTPTGTATSTPGHTATPLAEIEPLPDPPESPDESEALAFVREYERVAARNRLVEHGGASEARRPDVGDPRATVVVAADEGFYLFGACRASARYEGDGGFTINRHEVPHFVGRDGSHEIGEWSAVICEVAEEAYAAADAGENAAAPGERAGAEIHLFRFDGAERSVSVTVEYLDAGAPRRAFSRTVDPHSDGPDPGYEVVLANVAVRTGEYRIKIEVPDAAADVSAAAAEWTLSGPDDPSWSGLSVFVGEDGRPHVGLPETDDDSLVPGPSRCFRHEREHEN